MSDENPHTIQQVPLHSEMWKCGVVQLPWTNFRKCRIIYLCDARHVCKQKGVNFSTSFKARYVCVIFLQYSYKCVHIKKLM
jgi:hypothetical protein